MKYLNCKTGEEYKSIYKYTKPRTNAHNTKTEGRTVNERMNATDWLQNVTCKNTNLQTTIQLKLIIVAARETNGKGTKADEKDAPPA